MSNCVITFVVDDNLASIICSDHPKVGLNGTYSGTYDADAFALDFLSDTDATRAI